MSTAQFKAVNTPFGYTPYIVFPIQREHGMTYHVRGPGSIESVPYSTRDAAETQAKLLASALNTGMVFEEAANA